MGDGSAVVECFIIPCEWGRETRGVMAVAEG
jgi:hypothetical protein